jgi:hypothetical protein
MVSISHLRSSLTAPSKSMSWTQLAGATIFVMVVAVAWRQVTLIIMREI